MLPCVTLRVEAMKTLGVALVAVALSAAVARADDQQWFNAAPRLAPAASFVAAKHIDVECPVSWAAWRAALEARGGNGSEAGFADIGSARSTWPRTCARR
jgi:hypothetical protein